MRIGGFRWIVWALWAPMAISANSDIDSELDAMLGIFDSAPVAERPAQAAEPTPAPSVPTDTPAARSPDALALEVMPVEPLRADEEVVVPPAAPPRASLALEEIVVTAERRTASLQDTPISIEAFDTDKLTQRGIQGIQDLAGNVPSMVIEPHPLSSAALRISIRGIGVNDTQVTQDPAVGIYLDGVYIARSSGLAFELADLERIEVLRGPQGTLYGRNTTGGAVNMVTRRPSTEALTFTQNMTVGSRNQLTAKSSLNLPLGDNFAIKLAGFASQRDGWMKNSGPGRDFGDREEYAGRLDARWFASDRLMVDYSFDITDLEAVNLPFQAQIPSFTDNGQAEFFKEYAQRQSIFSDRRLDSLSSGPEMLPSTTKILGHTLVLGTSFGNDLDLKYIGAYRKLSDRQYQDLGGGAGSLGYRVDTGAYDGPAGIAAGGGQPTPAVVPRNFNDQWSHEVQLSGAFSERLTFITGAYTFRETGGEDGGPRHHVFSAQLDPSQLDPLLNLIPGLRAPLGALLFPRLAAFWDFDIAIKNSAHAIFGQLSWVPPVLDDRLRFTLGLRQSWDRREALKSFVQDQYVEVQVAGISLLALPIPSAVLGGIDTFENVKARRDDRNFSPSLNVTYALTDDATTYLSYSTAYKSGGFNTRDPQISAASGNASDGTNYGFGFVEGFKPEVVRSLELGLKSQWMDRRLRLNSALFYTRYTDLQTNFLIPGTISDTKARNAGRALITGLELESAFVVTEGLILALQYGYLDAEVQEVIDIDGNNVANLYPFPSAAPHSGSVNLDWVFMQTSWGMLRAYVNYQYLGPRKGLVITEERRGLTAGQSYGTYSMRLTASEIRLGRGGSLDIAAWGRNLFDKAFTQTAIDNLAHSDRSVMWGDARAYGVDFTYRFE